jgi:hypothetical protein
MNNTPSVPDDLTIAVVFGLGTYTMREVTTFILP